MTWRLTFRPSAQRELDALDPAVLIALVQGEIDSWRDEHQWNLDTAAMENERVQLGAVRDRWDEVVTLVGGGQ